MTVSISGAPAGIRTPDTLLKRQVLCLLSYWGIPYSDNTTTNSNMDLLLRERAGKRIWSRWAQAKPVPSYGMERARSDVAGTAGLEPTISESKSGVLPLHYVPPYRKGIGITPNPFYHGVGKGTRTLDTRNHNPVL